MPPLVKEKKKHISLSITLTNPKIITLPSFHSWRRIQGREKKFVLVARNTFTKKRPTYTLHNDTGLYRISKASRFSMRLKMYKAPKIYDAPKFRKVPKISKAPMNRVDAVQQVRILIQHNEEFSMGVAAIFESAQSSNFISTSTHSHRWEDRESGFVLQSLHGGDVAYFLVQADAKSRRAFCTVEERLAWTRAWRTL